MSIATVDVLPTLTAVQRCAEVFAAACLSSGGWTSIIEDEPTAFAGARVFSVLTIDGTRLSVMLGPDVVRTLIAGPPPAESLSNAVIHPLTSAAQELSALGIGSIDTSTLIECDMAEVLATGDGLTVSVRLMDAGNHHATVIVALVDLFGRGFANHLKDKFSTGTVATAPQFDALPDGPVPFGHQPVSVLSDVEMGVTVELGRARMIISDILALTIGSVIELDRIAGSPVDVLVNGTLIARGEVVVIDEEFGVRVTEVMGHQTNDRTRR